MLSFFNPAAKGGTKFARDRSGQFTTMFAIFAPVMVAAVAVAANYSSAVSHKQQLQAAADAAALEATTAMTHGGTAAQAKAAAITFFASNAPGYDPNKGTLNVYSGQLNGVASTTVSYSTSQYPSLIGGVLGGSGTMTVSVLATSTAATTTSTGGGRVSFTGYGSIWGDPHLNAADGSQTTFGGCATTPASWFNALSDAGFEVNISCVFDPYWNEEGIQSFSAIIGSHTLAMTAQLPTISGGVISYNGQGWSGGITLDGNYIAPTAGVHSYLGGVATVNVHNPNDPSDGNNWVRIAYVNGSVQYTVTMNYDVWELGTLSISAVNAGLCGVPGGIWGQTLAGIDDITTANNRVATAVSTTPQFNWSVCAPQQAITTTSHLTQ